MIKTMMYIQLPYDKYHDEPSHILKRVLSVNKYRYNPCIVKIRLRKSFTNQRAINRGVIVAVIV